MLNKNIKSLLILIALIGCASAQDYNRFDSNTVPIKSQDELDQKKPAPWLWKPQARARRLEMDMERHKTEMAAKERERISDVASRQIGGILAIISDPKSMHFEDLTFLNDVFKNSKEARAYIGGGFEAKPTGKKHKTGDEIYSVRIFDPLTNEDIRTFNETAKGVITWFDGQTSYLNEIKKAITRGGQTSYSNEVKPDAYCPNNHFNTNQRNQQQGFGHSWDNKNIYIQPYKHNAYGLGVHSDSTGKPFEWKTQDGQKSQGKIKIDGFGLGVGMDEFGRPVKPSPLEQ
jgi:hypothetical protein